MDSACHINKDDVQGHLVVPVWVFLAAVFEPGYSNGMLGIFSFQGENFKGVSIRAEFKFNKMNIPLLRRNLGSIKVGGSAWDRAHKDGIRAA
eukprot:1144581-Pelagomonas_calceolata.AAC.13